MSYAFKDNLLSFSDNQIITNALPEWERLCYQERDTQDRTCVCGRYVKNVYFLINTRNGNVINVGTGCIKKF